MTNAARYLFEEAILKDLAQISMNTVTGKKVYPFAMTPDQVEIEAIAHHLAVQARWNGATKHPIWQDKLLLSVAEHSVHVALYVRRHLGRPDLTMQALLHDATEAYIPDLIRPLKHSEPFRKPFEELETHIWLAVADRYSLPWQLDPLVKLADDAVCWAEWEQVVPHSEDEVWCGATTVVEEPANIKVGMWTPSYAKAQFLGLFNTMLVEMKGDLSLAA